MVTPNTLTSRYLAEAAERGDRAAGLVRLAREQFDLAATSYDGDCLTRPVFLEHAEFSVLRDSSSPCMPHSPACPFGCLAGMWQRSPAPWG